MTLSDVQEQQLRIAWLEKQMEKANYDMEAERRRARRETWSIIVTAIGIAIAAFAAGHFIR